mmetsp:Transcript_124346/g.247948  ORF Transcript_124346/g.247948 Transcript_124346/m.247948 type:complete len:208 (+) Transcript_124346:91-714(+)
MEPKLKMEPFAEPVVNKRCRDSVSASLELRDRCGLADSITQDTVDFVQKQMFRLQEAMELHKRAKTSDVGRSELQLQEQILALQQDLIAERKKNQKLEEGLKKAKEGYLDTAGLNRDNVRITAHTMEGVEKEFVTTCVLDALRNYSAKGHVDLDEDLVGYLGKKLGTRGQFYEVMAGFHNHGRFECKSSLHFYFPNKNNYRIVVGRR